MSYHKSPADCQRFQVVRQEFLQADGLAFSEILSEEQIEQTFDEAGTWAASRTTSARRRRSSRRQPGFR